MRVCLSYLVFARFWLFIDIFISRCKSIRIFDTKELRKRIFCQYFKSVKWETTCPSIHIVTCFILLVYLLDILDRFFGESNSLGRNYPIMDSD